MPIVKLPTRAQYLNEAFLCAGAAFNIILDVLDQKATAAELICDHELDEEDYKNACQHQYRNALIFAQQSFEMYLRGLVCGVSPYLLIPDQNAWVRKSESQDIAFSSIRSVGAAELPLLACAVTDLTIDDDILQAFSSLRDLRNQLVHAIPEFTISHHQLLVQLALVFKYIGHRTAIAAYCAYNEKSHVSLLYPNLDSINIAHRALRIFRSQITSAFTDKNLLGEIEPVELYCPQCFAGFDFDFAEFEDFQPTCISSEENTCLICFQKSKSITLNSGNTIFYDPKGVSGPIVLDAQGNFLGWAEESEISLLRDALES